MTTLYIINDSILFNTEDGTFTLLDDEQNVFPQHHYDAMLTLTGKRIFNVLLEAHPHVVPRQYIYSSVWDHYGLQSSNSSLNQYLSKIRSLIKTLGYTGDTIISLPKAGVKLSDSLDIYCLRENDPRLPYLDIPNTLSKQEVNKKPAFTMSKVLLYLLTLVSVVTLFYFSNLYNLYSAHAPKKQDMFFYDVVNSCPFYTIRPIEKSERSQFDKLIANVVEDYPLKCNEDEVVIFNYDDNFSHREKTLNDTRIFVAFCRFGSDKTSFRECYNNYQYRGGNEK